MKAKLYDERILLAAFCKEHNYRRVPGKRPLPGKRPCTAFQGSTVAASIQTYRILIPGKHPCGPKSRVMLKPPWALTRDSMVHTGVLSGYKVVHYCFSRLLHRTLYKTTFRVYMYFDSCCGSHQKHAQCQVWFLCTWIATFWRLHCYR